MAQSLSSEHGSGANLVTGPSCCSLGTAEIYAGYGMVLELGKRAQWPKTSRFKSDARRHIRHRSLAERQPYSKRHYAGSSPAGGAILTRPSQGTERGS